jgi:hypothetical protein
MSERTCQVCQKPLRTGQRYTCSMPCRDEFRRRQNRQDPHYGEPGLSHPKWLAQWRGPRWYEEPQS